MFQIRHRKFGVYQGHCLGLGFWHPLSDMPEQGYCEFETVEDAEEFIRFLCTEASDPLNFEDLSIEPFEQDISDTMISTGKLKYLNSNTRIN